MAPKNLIAIKRHYLENRFFSLSFSLSLFLSFSSLQTLLSLSLWDRQGRGRKTHKELLKLLSKILITSKNLLKSRSIFKNRRFHTAIYLKLFTLINPFWNWIQKKEQQNVSNTVHWLPILYWIKPSSSEGRLFQRQESKMFLVLAS